MIEEVVKVREDGCWLNLIEMNWQFKNLSSHMDGVGNDNNLGFDVEICSLVDTTPDSKEFCFSSASVLVIWTAWWIVFVKDLLHMYVCEIEVATLFLMLASDGMMAMEGDEKDSKTILSS